MTTGDDLFAAVRASPDDEPLRLVYADWLEEQGDPRGEFIRVQCALARIPHGAPERTLLEMREGELLRLHIDQFRPPRLTGVWWGDFYKGFVDRCRFASADAFIAKGREAFDAAPLRTVMVGQLGPISPVGPDPEGEAFARALAGFQPLERLTEFDMGYVDSEKAKHALLASPYLTGLVRLRAPRNGMGEGPVVALAGGPPMPRLKELYLSRSGLGAAAMETLARSKRFPALEKLDLSENPLVGVGMLGEMEARLTWLSLSETYPPAHELTRLLLGPATAQLTYLNLCHNGLDDDGATALASASCRATLQELLLQQNQLSPQGVVTLAGGEWPALEHLTLGGNRVGAAGAAALAASNTPRIDSLELSDCQLHDAGAIALAGFTRPALRRLDLARNQIGPAGVRALANSEGMVALKSLDLQGNPLGREGGLALAEGALLRSLEYLELDLDDVGSRSIRALRAIRNRFPFWTG